RDDRADETPAFELRESQMRRVRFGLHEHREAQRVKPPDLLGVTAERLDRRVLLGVELGPEPRWGAEVRDPRLGRDPRSRERDARLIPPYQAGEPRNRSIVALL